MNVILERKYDCKIEGNVLSGNTFPIKEFIKRKLDGKWDSDRRVWIVNEAIIAKYLDLGVIKRKLDDSVVEFAGQTVTAPAQAPAAKPYKKVYVKAGYDASGTWICEEEANDF